MVKVYEAGEVYFDGKTPVPSYDEYKELVRKSDKLDKIMSDASTNQGDCQQIVEDNLNRQIARLQEQLNEAVKTTKDQELIIKKLKRRRICDNQKTKARKEHINELIEQIKELKEELAGRGRLINELKIQRKEANELLKSLTPLDRWQDDSNVNSYLKKWGVK